MDKIRLGSTSLKVTPICHGCWQASPKFWGEQPRDVLIAALRRSVECGVNFFDTADAYGDGLSEEILGEAFSVFKRKDLVIATKVFHHFYPDGHRHPDLSYDYILSECDASLKRLRTDYIDLYQLHSFDVFSDLADTTRALDKLKKQGKIRHYGLSNFTVEQIRLARSYGKYETIQPRYNLLQSEAEKDILPYCKSEKMGVLVYSPLYHGLLAGKYGGTEKFDDFRGKNPDFQGERFKSITAQVKSLQPVADRYSLSIVQLILAATLATPLIDCVITGIKTPAQIEEAAKAGEIKISREDYFTVRNALGKLSGSK